MGRTHARKRLHRAHNDLNDLTEIKKARGVPDQVQSCHTAVVNGYVVEGHVPAADVHRLLKEKPAVAGIAVGGMPMGSPGMEVPGTKAQAFDVMSFDKSGALRVFAEALIGRRCVRARRLLRGGVRRRVALWPASESEACSLPPLRPQRRQARGRGRFDPSPDRNVDSILAIATRDRLGASSAASA